MNPRVHDRCGDTLGGMQNRERSLTVIAFMSGPWGRLLRIVAGLALYAVALTSGGWAWLLAIPGTVMLLTGLMNYCPAGLMMSRPTNRSEFMASLKPTNFLDVNK